MYSNTKQVGTHTQGSVYSNIKQVCTHTGIFLCTHAHMDQCIQIPSKYAQTQGKVYSKDKQVHTHRDPCILNGQAIKYAHTEE